MALMSGSGLVPYSVTCGWPFLIWIKPTTLAVPMHMPLIEHNSAGYSSPRDASFSCTISNTYFGSGTFDAQIASGPGVYLDTHPRFSTGFSVATIKPAQGFLIESAVIFIGFRFVGYVNALHGAFVDAVKKLFSFLGASLHNLVNPVADFLRPPDYIGVAHGFPYFSNTARTATSATAVG
jgi:hypothetical protein